MKLKRHFFYTETSRTVSRTYGGSAYTLAIWEVIKKGEIIRHGTTTACTRGHKGEAGEAWGFIVHNVLTARQKKALLAHPDANPSHGGSWGSYYPSGQEEKTGYILQSV